MIRLGSTAYLYSLLPMLFASFGSLLCFIFGAWMLVALVTIGTQYNFYETKNIWNITVIWNLATWYISRSNAIKFWHQIYIGITNTFKEINCRFLNMYNLISFQEHILSNLEINGNYMETFVKSYIIDTEICHTCTRINPLICSNTI